MIIEIIKYNKTSSDNDIYDIICFISICLAVTLHQFIQPENLYYGVKSQSEILKITLLYLGFDIADKVKINF